jgi:hypothetical protein
MIFLLRYGGGVQVRHSQFTHLQSALHACRILCTSAVVNETKLLQRPSYLHGVNDNLKCFSSTRTVLYMLPYFIIPFVHMALEILVHIDEELL